MAASMYRKTLSSPAEAEQCLRGLGFSTPPGQSFGWTRQTRSGRWQAAIFVTCCGYQAAWWRT